MKHCLLTLASLLVAASTFAQGTINFANRVSGAVTVDARVSYNNSGAPIPADGNYVAQLYAGPVGGALTAVGAPIPFRSTPAAGQGYWAGETRNITGVAAGSPADVRVVAWASSLGATFEEAQGKSLGGWGQSSLLSGIVTGGAGTPPSLPAALAGLQSFEISTIVPEPSIAALGLLGAALLIVRRKK